MFVTVVICGGRPKQLRREPLSVQLQAEVDSKAYDEEDADAASADRVEGRLAFECQLDRYAEQIGTPDHMTAIFCKMSPSLIVCSNYSYLSQFSHACLLI